MAEFEVKQFPSISEVEITPSCLLEGKPFKFRGIIDSSFEAQKNKSGEIKRPCAGSNVGRLASKCLNVTYVETKSRVKIPDITLEEASVS